MCDYSLNGLPTREANEGEMLVTHRFQTGSRGLASPDEVTAAANASQGSAFSRRSKIVGLIVFLGIELGLLGGMFQSVHSMALAAGIAAVAWMRVLSLGTGEPADSEQTAYLHAAAAAREGRLRGE